MSRVEIEVVVKKWVGRDVLKTTLRREWVGRKWKDVVDCSG